MACTSAAVKVLLDPLLERYSDDAPGLDSDVIAFSISEENAGDNGSILYVVREGSETVNRSTTALGVVDYLLWRISVEVISRSSDRLAIHAGAVSKDGRGVILPAPPDSGKTTLTAALTAAGFGYLSDEVALIDPVDGLMHPFARPLWMDASSVILIEGLRERATTTTSTEERSQYHVLAGEIREDSIGSACRLRCVVFPSYRPEAEVELTPVSRAEALVLISEQCFNLRDFGDKGLEILAGALKDASAYKLTMGDLATATREIERLVSE